MRYLFPETGRMNDVSFWATLTMQDFLLFSFNPK